MYAYIRNLENNPIIDIHSYHQNKSFQLIYTKSINQRHAQLTLSILLFLGKFHSPQPFPHFYLSLRNLPGTPRKFKSALRERKASATGVQGH